MSQSQDLGGTSLQEAMFEKHSGDCCFKLPRGSGKDYISFILFCTSTA